MIIKKFQASTETEAILLAKEELGSQAIVLNIKHESPKGFYRMFKKATVEVTAAIDDTNSKEESKVGTNNHFASTYQTVMSISKDAVSRGDVIVDTPDTSTVESQQEPVHAVIEDRLNNLQSLLEQQMQKQEQNIVEDNVFDIPCIKLIRSQLLDHEVREEYADQIIREVERSIEKDSSVDNALSNVYQKIILKLGQPLPITYSKGKTKYIFFIGPTGVGKTTTIAKIASSLKLNLKVKVAMVTLDTYRIAAVEQLRTYANILGVPIRVVYSTDEMDSVKEEFSEYDIVLIDTAGRSHKYKEQVDDIANIVNSIDDSQKEVYLVLSATTKYKDLVHIVETYGKVANYRLIFTKLDETSTIGNILNIRMLTNAPLSYMTWGQNVPDDIGKVNAQKVAKQLLGGKE